VDQTIHFHRFKLIEELIFLIPALILAFLHFFIFLFDKRTNQNLYYVIFLLSFSFFIFIAYSGYYASYQTTNVLLSRFGPLALNFVLLFGAFTIFAIFEYKHKYAKIFLLIAIVLGIIGFITAGHKYVYYLSFIFISYVSYQAGRCVFHPNKNFGKDKKIIQIGFGIFSLSGIYQMLLSFDIVWPILGSNSIFLFGVLAFLLSMSIALAKEFVQTRKDLEGQLIQVKELSQKTLEQELSAKELATEKKILEIENARKTKELDEARHLQLSMLPNDIPILDDLEISVYFTTATEVGGDYYDFLHTADGTLIIALGDATGHGTKAGLMVAIIKGLFKSLAEKSNIPEFFSKSTEIIKDMKLGNLFMSLLLLRIKNKTVTASAAGMPPVLIYRYKEKIVESIVCKSMPIGAHKDFPYESNEFKVETGDVILIFSDGLPELFNDKKEMFDYNRVNLKLSELGELESKDILNGFKDSINAWRKDKLPDDDITLLAIKIK
jgi:serine phosphatase RsbU (regulator of sigma subunit)